ncbi:MAG: HAD-IA family hydrolase [Succinivibrio sp.]|nr:HAD-IA family hydrolase [Succinivibrio sp.]
MRFFKALQPIKAISFDLDDTLYDNVPIISQAEVDFARYLCTTYQLPEFTAKPQFWAELKDKTLAAEPALANDVTALRIHALMQSFSFLHLHLSFEQASTLIAKFIQMRSQIKVPAASFEILDRLKVRYPLAALSNGNSDLRQSGLEHCFNYDLRPNLDSLRSKPQPDLFYAYARLLKLKPSEILHIGDDPVTDVEGAMLAGCQCAWLRGGYAGRCAQFPALTAVPTFMIDSLDELSFLWTD